MHRYVYPQYLIDMVDDNTHLETMIELDQRNLTVQHSDGTVTMSSANDDSDADEDATPRQRDFHADEISASEGKPAEVLSDNKSWQQTPSALKKGHSSQDAFQDDMDSNTNSEGGQGEEVTGMRGGGKYNATINVVCQVEILVHCSYLSN